MNNLSDTSIAELIATGESFRCERKRDFSGSDWKEKLCQTICAFANDIAGYEQIGVIAFGINDVDGTTFPIEVTDELELKIQNLRGEGKIIPLPSFVAQKRVYLGQQILCVEVHPAISTPVKYDGRVWVRPGNSTQRASAEDERRLNEKRKWKEQPDDAQVLETFRINDLNTDYFKSQYLPQAFAHDVLKANSRTLEEQLASTKMIGTAASGALHPTVLGMLCLGLSPTDAIPGAYVQFLRLDGTDLSSAILDEATIQGNVADVIQQTEAKFVAHNSTPVDFISQDKERRTPQYPKEAFQQLFRNAVLHRTYLGTHSPIRVYWYTDRIEITNPGGPYGAATVSNFGKPGITDYRNPNLAGALKDLDYVQKFGAGINVARKSLQVNGNELVLEPDVNFITVVMRQHPRTQHE